MREGKTRLSAGREGKEKNSLGSEFDEIINGLSQAVPGPGDPCSSQSVLSSWPVYMEIKGLYSTDWWHMESFCVGV